MQRKSFIRKGPGLLACLAALVACLWLGQAGVATAASFLKMDAEDLREQTWNLNADRMVSLAGGDILEATENVELRMGGDVLRADFARYYVITGWVYLSGNVELMMGGDRLRAEEAEFNLSSKTGWLINGEIFLAEPHAYFRGERVTKHWGNVYSFRNAKVTACSGEVPAWSFSADNAIVEIDGYAQLWGTSFQVKDIPVLYSPYAILPAKTSRQSGFLMPEFGQSSTRGYYYNQPFFWAIDQSRDMTINEYYMSRKGFMHGVNYRSRGEEDEFLWLRLDFMHDRTVDRFDSSGKYDGDGYTRNNHSRYWVRGMYDWNTPVKGWKVRADLDWVSDQDFLREFRNASFGFDPTRRELFRDFRRDFTELTEKRRNTMMLFKEWDRVSFYLSGVYTQNQYLGNGNASRSSDDTVQRLPELNLYLHKGRIFQNLPLELHASAQGGYYYRREGTRGSRFDFSPRLSLPLRGEYGSLMVTGGFNSTWYNSDRRARDEETGKRAKKNATRLLPEISAEASTEFSRAFALATRGPMTKAGDSQWTAIRHSIVPRVAYQNRSTDSQGRNPNYERYDRLESVNELVYSVDNIITRKREQMLARQGENGEQELYAATDYLDILRLRLEQKYDIRESRRQEDREQYKRKPWRDVMAEISVAWDHLLTLNSRSFWSPENSRLTRHEHGVTVNIPEKGHLYAGMDFRQEVDDYVEQREEKHNRVVFEGDLNITGPLSVL
ncbi:LPS assembly protein LptD, partial [Desulfovibrio sp. OttesenSCG-928-C14]|nr:LPS assembly protein LptD [Desulfovibrio sp. OttesenSCG-928-C14]